MNEEKPIEFQREELGKLRTWRLRSETWDTDTDNSASYDTTSADLAAAFEQMTTDEKIGLGKPLTPDDVKAIARAVVAEVAGAASEACKASGHGYPLAKLAEAAKEET